MNNWVYLNDRFVLEEEAKLSVNDLAIQRGYGIFDFLKTVGHIPYFIDDHLNRFYFSAEQIRLAVPLNKQQLTIIVHELIRKNNIPDSGIKFILTGGNSSDGFSIGEPNLIITQQPLQWPPSDAFTKGIHLITFEHQRQLPHIKTIDYLMSLWLQPHIKEKGADDVLYHCNGSVTECPRANFFILTKEEQLVTPAENILYGITRNNLLHCARNMGLAVQQRTLHLAEIKTATAAFIASTTKGVLPVARIDNHTFSTVPDKLVFDFNEALNSLLPTNIKQVAEQG